MNLALLGDPAGGVKMPVNLGRLIETRLLIQGGSGSGKSKTVRRLLEETHGQVQQFVLDVEDEYPSLREHFDYVLAGPGRDCPVEVRSSGLLATRLLELGTSAIINLYELKPAERPRFVRLFLESLMNAPRATQRDALVVVEECAVFAPQAGRESESTNAVIDLAQRGRKRGLCLVAVTQRIADLNKSVVAQCQNRLIGKTTLDVDVKRAAYELGFDGREAARVLTELRPGDFFAIGPALCDAVTRFHVADTITRHGFARGHGERKPAPPRETVRAALAKLADLPQEAEAEAHTVEDLRNENARLRRQIAAKPAAAPVERVEVPVLTKEHCSALEAAHSATVRAVEGLRAAADSIAGSLRAAVPRDHGPRVRTPTPVAPLALPTREERRAENLGPERRMLVLLAQRSPLRLTRAQLATLAGLAPSGGTFQTYLSRLRAGGYLEERDGSFAASEAGLDVIGAVPPAPSSPDEVLELWLENVGRNAAGRLLARLASIYPRGESKAELAAACDLEARGGTFQTYLSKLRRNSLVEERSGLVFASHTVMGNLARESA